MALPTVALPGQILGPASKYSPGSGTHLYEAQICASLAGLVSQSSSASSSASQDGTTSTAASQKAPIGLPTISVLRATVPSTSNVTPALPSVNSTILCRITRLSTRQANVALLSIEHPANPSTNTPPTPPTHTALAPGSSGLIRQQDIRATEKDRVKVIESFRVGDIVRAIVISLGDQQNYYLSTASNRLGVLVARSEGGNVMFPVSWREFEDPVTGGGRAGRLRSRMSRWGGKGAGG